MGDMVGELSYGVTISEADYNRVQGEFYHLDEHGYQKEEKKNKLTKVLGIRNPYETYEYLIYIKVSFRKSYNGTVVLTDRFHIDYDVWDDEITPFLEKHKIKPLSEPNWMLTGRFG